MDEIRAALELEEDIARRLAEPLPEKHALSYYAVLGTLTGQLMITYNCDFIEGQRRAVETLKRCKPTRRRRAKRWGEL